jgi:branched-chain amino acid transport system ATP-binding protein
LELIEFAAMLSVQDIHTYYGDSYILQGVSLELKSGQVVALLGRNGVGKTTLARSIMGLTPAKRGRILFQNVDITNLPAHRIARLGLGLVPQGRQIFRSLSVKENLEVTARGQGVWSLDNILALFPNLHARLRSLAGKLSGGEQQMLAAARALVGHPALLVMDEPTEGLAPLMVRELGRVVETLKQTGTSILLIEQQLAFALRYADTVFIMSKGRIVHHCSPQELASDPQMKARYLGV